MEFSETQNLYDRRRFQVKIPKLQLASLGRLFATVKRFVTANKKFVALAAAAVFLFYWFEIRPIQLNNSCALIASDNARALVQSKAQVATDPERAVAYQQLASQNMYLRTDYESFFTKCMRSHGVNL